MVESVFGGGDVVIRVDMTDAEIRVEPCPDDWRLLGGRALCARILIDSVDPRCDPLGAANALVIAPGLLSGTAAPTSGRLSFGAKSPLTKGIKEANSGGNPGQHLAKLGVRALVVTGTPANSLARFGLEIDERGIRLVVADDLAGIGNYATCQRLAQRYAERASFIVCGPAGEHRLAAASIACTDLDNRYPTRHAARGGLGAVMGAKGLKFIAIDTGRRFAAARVAVCKPEFRKVARQQSARYLGGPQRMAKGTARAVADHLARLRPRRRGRRRARRVAGRDGAALRA